MRLAINPGHFNAVRKYEEKRTLKDSISLVKKAGFDVIDLSALSITDAEDLRSFIEENKMCVNQTHAPFYRYEKDINYESFSKNLMKAVENTYNIGAKIMVVHGDEFDFSKPYSPEAALEFNYRYFAPVVEYAENHDLMIAFETVFEDIPSKPRFTSKLDDLITLTEKFGSKHTGICWDIGHAKVSFGNDKHIEMLETAGERVISTHIHDNYYGKDLHLFPFTGETVWEDFVPALKKIGYKGDFTYEFVYDRLPVALIDDYLSLLYKTGMYLINL